ncbi:MAG: poly(R)-hydroxyalkanoic acid synthase subunit PhaE [Pseudomonadota bacterium]
MADKPDFAAKSFTEMVTEWERNFDAFANQVMGTEAYSQAMNDMQKAQLTYQQGMTQIMAQQLAAMNMPTREDIVQLTELVRKLDRRVERIEEQLTMNSPTAKRGKRPARTRQPPAASAGTDTSAESNASEAPTKPARKTRARKTAASDTPPTQSDDDQNQD